MFKKDYDEGHIVVIALGDWSTAMLVLCGLFVLAIIIFLILKYFVKGDEDFMREFATQHGMVFTPFGLLKGWMTCTVEGEYKGLPINMRIQPYVGGEVHHLFVSAKVEMGSRDFLLCVSRRSMLGDLLESIGRRKFRMDDENFDKRCRINTNDFSKAKIYLNETHREAIMGLFALGYSLFCVGNGEINVKKSSSVPNVEFLNRTADALVVLAKGVEVR